MKFSAETQVSPSEWNATAARLPGAHVLQTYEWGQVKARTGWRPIFCTWSENSGEARAAALVLERSAAVRSLSSGLRLLYVPRGPLLEWQDARLRSQVLDDLRELTHRRRALFIKIDPDVSLGTGIPGAEDHIGKPVGLDLMKILKDGGWRFSEEQIQFRNTMLIDLNRSEELLLAGMKQKARYNLRLAERKGVSIRACWAG